ncbi:MAG: AbrB/MazE/SpoVT family DNA-binding domain-containing protein [Flavobacterium sp.]|nr:AbrB/MazE/SpoVT family DNA-binding domain-containing protein [Flavobacterium sp.]
MISTHQTQIIKIGNSNGIRIPKDYVKALGSKEVILELINNSLIITPIKTTVMPRNKWENILSKMVIDQNEEFNDFDTTLADGIDDL